MIDLFSLAQLKPGEELEQVYRSHPLRLFARLGVAAICIAIPFFFLFDYRGWIWIVAVICWLIGGALFWLAFDVWSSSMVIVTSDRVIGAERGSWGRVRIHDWRLSSSERIPIWKSSSWLPWLGSLVWTHQEHQPLTLAWSKPHPRARIEKAHASLAVRRKQLIGRLKNADASVVERVEAVIDGPISS